MIHDHNSHYMDACQGFLPMGVRPVWRSSRSVQAGSVGRTGAALQLRLRRWRSVVLGTKSAWRNDTTHIVMWLLNFMRRLTALQSQPRLHLDRCRRNDAVPKVCVRFGASSRAWAMSPKGRYMPDRGQGSPSKTCRSRWAARKQPMVTGCTRPIAVRRWPGLLARMPPLARSLRHGCCRFCI